MDSLLVAVVVIVAVFVLGIVLLVSSSPTPMRVKLARFLGLEIEGGGTGRHRQDQITIVRIEPVSPAELPSPTDTSDAHSAAELAEGQHAIDAVLDQVDQRSP